jgi:chemotaxis family two-component system sensor kinase Cph1
MPNAGLSKSDSIMSSGDDPPQDALTRLKSDLELISYITSHDLQAPLRIILRSCEELQEHPGLSDDEEGKRTLQAITGQAAGMKALLDGLLEYVRAETFVVKHTPLDMNEIASLAQGALEQEIKTAATVITSDHLPQVVGHRGRLTRLFAHLLENALKFRGELPPSIHISARRSGMMWEFCIKDNGIGINPEHHTIIFTLFQRLHSEEYPGIGAGLALSRKIVESHGGQIRVESDAGEGSRFIFTLPAVD